VFANFLRTFENKRLFYRKERQGRKEGWNNLRVLCGLCVENPVYISFSFHTSINTTPAPIIT
jgi:hypothetical protein